VGMETEMGMGVGGMAEPGKRSSLLSFLASLRHRLHRLYRSHLMHQVHSFQMVHLMHLTRLIRQVQANLKVVFSRPPARKKGNWGHPRPRQKGLRPLCTPPYLNLSMAL